MNHAPWRDIARRTTLSWATIERQQKRVQETQLARENAKHGAGLELADIAAMRPLQKCGRSLLVRGPDDAPPGAGGDRGDQPALVGVGVQEKQ